MQLAILIVLIFISVLMAPWLLGVIAAFAAIYGIYLVTFFIISFTAFLVILVLIAVRWRKKPETVTEINGERKRCNSCQVEVSVHTKICNNCGYRFN